MLLNTNAVASPAGVAGLNKNNRFCDISMG